MPVLSAIKAEVGTSGVIERLDLTGDPYRDVGAAVRLEHYCDDSSCDIHVALDEAETPMTAAWLLIGATETPLLERVLDYYGVDFREFPDDWDEWVAHHNEHGRKCEGCGSYTYADDFWEPEQCGNCLAPLPVPSDDEEDGDATDDDD